jgi:hypothetical protein
MVSITITVTNLDLGGPFFLEFDLGGGELKQSPEVTASPQCLG